MKATTIKILKTIGILILAYVLLELGSIIGYLITIPLMNSSNAGIAFGGMYAMFIGIWIVFVAFCLIFKSFRHMFARLGAKAAGNNVKTVLILGLILGLGLNLLAAAIALLNKDIALSFSMFDPLMILYFIVVITIQSGAEELVARWFIYGKIKEYFPRMEYLAIILSALFFSALHLGNSGVTALALLNIALVGVLYALVIYYFDSFWAAVVAHMSWNFCQNILLGLPNSGIVTEYSIFNLDAATARNSFAYDVEFGLEGTISACVILALAIVAIILIGQKKKNAQK